MSIEIVNVSKTYVTKGIKRTVFRNLNITIPRGVNFGVIGPNGAGKSTLLSLIAGSLMPDSGKIVHRMSVSWPIGYGGIVDTNLSGILNCRFIARIFDRDPKEVVDFVSDFTELGEYMQFPVKTFSGGMRARLNFAMSIAMDFDCLLIDEGMSAGDAYFQEKAERLMHERKGRCSLLYVTHNLMEVVRLCDQVLVLGGPQPELSHDVRRRVKEYAVKMSEQRGGNDKRFAQIAAMG
jgi:capsular polysaccharide transport system ATP-binding protein